MILLLLHQDKTYKEIETRLAIVSHTIKKALRRRAPPPATDSGRFGWKDRYIVDA